MQVIFKCTSYWVRIIDSDDYSFSSNSEFIFGVYKNQDLPSYLLVKYHLAVIIFVA